MSEQEWYLNSNGKVFGPVTTDELEQMFVENTVQRSDLVGVAGGETWLPAASVYEMFQQARANSSDESPANAAADILARMRSPKPAHIEGSESNSITAIGGLVSGGVQRMAGGVSSVSEGIGGLIGSAVAGIIGAAGFVLRLRHSKLTFVVLIGLLAAILLRNFRFSDSDNLIVFEQLATLGGEIELMRGAEGVTSDDWEQFRRESQESLEPAIKLLSEAASQEHPLLQTLPVPYVQSSESVVRGHLLECGYALRGMIKTQGGDENTRYAFTKNIGLAREKLTPGAVVPKPSGKTGNDDAATKWILIADGLIISGGLLWWWRRHRSAQT